MYRTAIILCLLALCSVFSYCQQSPKSNLGVFEAIISSGLDKYYYYPGINRNNLFIFEVNPDVIENNRDYSSSQIRFLRSIIKKTASQNNLNFSFSSGNDGIRPDSAYNLLVLKIIKLKTQYSGFKKNRFLGSKTILRNITVNIAAELKTSDGSVNLNDSIASTAADEVDYDNYEQLESSDYDFTAGVPPRISTLERVFFPVLVICVTAAATILFFAIRSK